MMIEEEEGEKQVFFSNDGCSFFLGDALFLFLFGLLVL
jgi:hypothetical protein